MNKFLKTTPILKLGLLTLTFGLLLTACSDNGETNGGHTGASNLELPPPPPRGYDNGVQEDRKEMDMVTES